MLFLTHHFMLNVLDRIPFLNGYKTLIGAVGLLLFGIGGTITGMLDGAIAIQVILEGLIGLGLSHKVLKAVREILAVTGKLPEAPADGN